MLDKLKDIKKEALKLIDNSKSLNQLKELKTKFLGKKSELNRILKSLKDLEPDLRKEIGKLANIVKKELNEFIESKMKEIKLNIIEEKRKREFIDITLPAEILPQGNLHILTKLTKEIEDIFISMGFSTAIGNEIETEYYNFQALNIPENHSSRDMWDTFYINSKNGFLLRTHTSPVQIHVMKKEKPPLAYISIGKCYRRDALDSTHSFFFHQIEGFMVDKHISFSHLKGVLSLFAKEMFGKDRKVKFVPSYFPFTEPSVEMYIDFKKDDKEDFLEILGAGMIHPYVLKEVGIDPEIYSGFAFGMGLERIAMLKYGINDIRLFFDNDIKFLKQF